MRRIHRPLIILRKKAAGPVIGSGWNPADHGSSSITLSGVGNRTVTSNNGSSQEGGCRGFSRSAGKLYFELTCAGTGGSTRIGMNQMSSSMGGDGTTQANIWGAATTGPSVHIWKLSSTNYLKNGGVDSGVAAGSIPNGTITGWAIDFDSGTAIMLIGNVQKWTGYTFTPNTPMAPCFDAQTNGDAATLFTAAADFTYAPPAGYSPWG